MKYLEAVWRELRKLRYFRWYQFGFRSGFRNYWYGEDMPYLRHLLTKRG